MEVDIELLHAIIDRLDLVITHHPDSKSGQSKEKGRGEKGATTQIRRRTEESNRKPKLTVSSNPFRVACLEKTWFWVSRERREGLSDRKRNELSYPQKRFRHGSSDSSCIY